jgi:hypothetical protein
MSLASAPAPAPAPAELVIACFHNIGIPAEPIPVHEDRLPVDRAFIRWLLRENIRFSREIYCLIFGSTEMDRHNAIEDIPGYGSLFPLSCFVRR